MGVNSNRFYRAAGPIFYVCVGCLIGVVLVLPLGFQLPDVYANLLGGVIGAVATIAGAFMVLARQIKDANDRARSDREEVSRKAEQELHALQCSVAEALYVDLRTAKVICESQLAQADAAKTWSKDAQLMWCQRIAGIPLVAFDKLGYLLINLGDISPNLIYIQAQVARISALVKGETEKPERYRNHAVMIDAIAENLPAFIKKLAATMDILLPFIRADAKLRPTSNGGLPSSVPD